MNAQEFVRKWGPQGSGYALNERAGAQAHFIDLCRVLNVPEPADRENYCFERGITQTGSAAQRTDGFADVWLRGHFAWEYKAPGKSLQKALAQLMMYALPLENPPLLVVSDRLVIEVHTHFNGHPSEKHAFALEEVTRPLYNRRPAWLEQAHEALDHAVALGYGWADYTPAMSDDEILRRLLALNLARSGAGARS